MRVSSSSSMLLASLAVSSLAAPLPGGSESQSTRPPAEASSDPSKREIANHQRQIAGRAAEGTMSVSSSVASISSFPSGTGIAQTSSFQLPLPSQTLVTGTPLIGRGFDSLRDLMNALDTGTSTYTSSGAHSSTDLPQAKTTNTPATTPLVTSGFDPLHGLMNAVESGLLGGEDAPAKSSATAASPSSTAVVGAKLHGGEDADDRVPIVERGHDDTPDGSFPATSAVPPTSTATSKADGWHSSANAPSGTGARHIAARSFNPLGDLMNELGINVGATNGITGADIPAPAAVHAGADAVKPLVNINLGANPLDTPNRRGLPVPPDFPTTMIPAVPATSTPLVTATAIPNVPTNVVAPTTAPPSVPLPTALAVSKAMDWDGIKAAPSSSFVKLPTTMVPPASNAALPVAVTSLVPRFAPSAPSDAMADGADGAPAPRDITEDVMSLKRFQDLMDALQVGEPPTLTAVPSSMMATSTESVAATSSAVAVQSGLVLDLIKVVGVTKQAPDASAPIAGASTSLPAVKAAATGV